jgi:hypothetical protein
MQQIFLSTDANQIFKVTLGGQSITLLMRYQTVSDSWFISIYNTVDNTPYVINRRLTPNYLVFGNILTDFVGDILSGSVSDPDQNIGRNDFNSVFGLYYLTESEASDYMELQNAS